MPWLTPLPRLRHVPAGIGEKANIFRSINSPLSACDDVTLGHGVNQGIYRFTQPAPNIEYDGVARVDTT